MGVAFTPETDRLLVAVDRHAPGFTIESERNGFFIVAPARWHRIAEGFRDQNQGRRLLLWLAGGPAPQRWRVRPWFGNSAVLDCRQGDPATIWTEPALCHFPAAKNILLPLYIGN